MYFKLAFRNIKNSARQYLVYFFTLVFGVVLFYTFNSISAQSVMLKLSEDQSLIFQSVDKIMAYISLFLCLVLGFLIIYTNKYMIKRRSKEFSIYLTLGMPKKKLSLILLFENMIIGFFSLVSGLFIGLITSQLLALLTSYMFEIEFMHFRFVFSWDSCLRTIVLFSLIYLMVYIFNIFTIRKISIIELMKKNEVIQNKRRIPWWCHALLAILGIGLFLYGDIKVSIIDVSTLNGILLDQCILSGIVGTVLFIFSGTNLFLGLVKKLQRVYYKNLHPFVFNQISSEMTISFVSLSITCLMIFTAICMLAGGMGLNATFTSQTKLAAPFDGSFQSPEPIKQVLAEKHINLDRYAKEEAEVAVYQIPSVKSQQFLKNKHSKEVANLYEFKYNHPVRIISLSAFNKNNELLNQPKVHLAKDQYLMAGNKVDFVNQLRKDTIITIGNKKLTLGQSEYYKQGCVNNLLAIDILYLVVPDQYLTQFKPNYYYLNIKMKSNKARDELNQQINHNDSNYFPGNFITKKYVYESTSMLGALASYIGIYIGFVFLMSSAVLLSIQQLTKSDKDVKRYLTLKQIGATRKMLNSALWQQITIFFGFPFILALFHSLFGLQYIEKVTETLGGVANDLGVTITFIIVFCVYLIYFTFTYFSARRQLIK